MLRIRPPGAVIVLALLSGLWLGGGAAFAQAPSPPPGLCATAEL
jgi:hypothetical protein